MLILSFHFCKSVGYVLLIFSGYNFSIIFLVQSTNSRHHTSVFRGLHESLLLCYGNILDKCILQWCIKGEMQTSASKRKFVLHLSKLAHTAFECEAYLFPVLFLCFTNITSLNMLEALSTANTWWWGTVSYMHIFAYTHTHYSKHPSHSNPVTFTLIPSNLSFLHARLRTATLRHDEEGQVNVVLKP